MERRILVAYASGSGSTAEVADVIGDVLESGDVAVDVLPAGDVDDVSFYSAVVLGSSIRLGRWLTSAVRFLETHQSVLSEVPVAYFTTCLTLATESAESRQKVLAYMEPILEMAPDVEPVALGLFAGSLDPSMQLLVPGGPYGDFRDWEAIRAWAEEIRPALYAGEAQADEPPVLAEVVLSYTDMAGVDLRRADLQRATLREATLSGADLFRANLGESDLRAADLREADLRGARLSWADLGGGDLSGANLERGNLMGTNLKEANLSGACLKNAVLNGATLTAAQLSNADLSGADLNWTKLAEADLEGADLRDASLGWADLRQANLDGARLENARYNEQTRWPAGFSAEEAGCIFVGGPR
ncbi:MAG: pentapeptide repeat-containing protein [Candidatus Promineifilaceae bacterium]|nr:pentapeptide repeat-containing protein [Candidatus Promineifilaceae bacterium]